MICSLPYIQLATYIVLWAGQKIMLLGDEEKAKWENAKLV